MTSHILTTVLTVASQDSLFSCEVEDLLCSRLLERETSSYEDSVTLELTGANECRYWYRGWGVCVSGTDNNHVLITAVHYLYVTFSCCELIHTSQAGVGGGSEVTIRRDTGAREVTGV